MKKIIRKARKKKNISNRLLIGILIILLGSNIALTIILFKPDFLTSAPNKIISKIQNKLKEDPILREINPSRGVRLGIRYGDLGPMMIKAGVIDLEKFKEVYVSNPLTKEQMEILTNGSNKEIRITRENSHFLLNFFWAVGLANKTKILTEGDMMRDGDASIYASTGGWSLSKDDPMNYYSNLDLIKLSPEQERMVWEVASNIYRPCCDNSTAFPDCNHGMALLGVLELMASQGATESQMYELSKYINAYWFPETYYELAQYFRSKERKNFKQVDGKTILGKDYSSATGYFNTKEWLTQQGIVKELPDQGGSCGV